jgi:hypothetical protein
MKRRPQGPANNLISPQTPAWHRALLRVLLGVQWSLVEAGSRIVAAGVSNVSDDRHDAVQAARQPRRVTLAQRRGSVDVVRELKVVVIVAVRRHRSVQENSLACGSP